MRKYKRNLGMIIGAVVSDVVSTLGIKHGWSSGVIQGLTLIINLIAMNATGLNGGLSPLTNGQIAVIAVIGGIASYLQGGKFGHGFISAGISARMGASDGIKRSMKAAGSIRKLITQVTIGGTVSRIGGGKFANGAGSAAFSMMLSSADGGSSYAEKNSGSVEAFDAQEGGKGPYSKDRVNKTLRSKVHIGDDGTITTDKITVSSEGIDEATAKTYIAAAEGGWSSASLDLDLVASGGDFRIVPCTSVCSVNSSDGGYLGAAEVGGRKIYYGASQYIDTPVHEVGHILGLKSYGYKTEKYHGGV